MKDAYEVLYQKEAELVRVRQEVESLRVAASLLSDDPGQIAQLETRKPPEPAFAPPSEAAATGTDGLSPIPSQPSFWGFLKPARR